MRYLRLSIDIIETQIKDETSGTYSDSEDSDDSSTSSSSESSSLFDKEEDEEYKETDSKPLISKEIKIYKWIIVGAGSAGIITIGKLLDEGFDPSAIL